MRSDRLRAPLENPVAPFRRTWFALQILGFEFASAADLREESEQHVEPELGPPMGFSGGSGGWFEQAFPDADDALPTPRRVE